MGFGGLRYLLAPRSTGRGHEVRHRTAAATGRRDKRRPPAACTTPAQYIGTLDGTDPQTAAYIAQERGRGPAPAGLYIDRVPKAIKRAEDRFGELLDPGKEATG